MSHADYFGPCGPDQSFLRTTWRTSPDTIKTLDLSAFLKRREPGRSPEI